MMGILWGKLRLLRRNPWGMIGTTVMCFLFAYLTGKTYFAKIEVPVFSSLPDEQVESIVKQLNGIKTLEFKLMSEKDVKDKVASAKANAGVELKKDSYTVYKISQTENLALIEQAVSRFYEKKQRKEAVLTATSTDMKGKLEQSINNAEKEPLFDVKSSFYKDKSRPKYNQALQSLFGFTLFFAIFTIAFSVVDILRDRKTGIWDRLILSPTSKTKIYLANLCYVFLVGYAQISTILLMFRFGIGVDFYGQFWKLFLYIIPYVLAIIAFSMLITGLVKTIGQFNALIPLFGVSFAMLGGAYWPIEIVSSKPLLMLSKMVPVTYGMEILKGVTISQLTFNELLFPIAVLLLMTVVMMGIGIRLIEKRNV